MSLFGAERILSFFFVVVFIMSEVAEDVDYEVEDGDHASNNHHMQLPQHAESYALTSEHAVSKITLFLPPSPDPIPPIPAPHLLTTALGCTFITFTSQSVAYDTLSDWRHSELAAVDFAIHPPSQPWRVTAEHKPPTPAECLVVECVEVEPADIKSIQALSAGITHTVNGDYHLFQCHDELSAAALLNFCAYVLRLKSNYACIPPSADLLAPAQPLPTAASSATPNGIPNRRLFVCQLGLHVTEAQIRTHFSPFGKITSFKGINRTDTLGLSYAFVQYENVENATAALNELNGQTGVFNPGDPVKLEVRFADEHISTSRADASSNHAVSDRKRTRDETRDSGPLEDSRRRRYETDQASPSAAATALVTEGEMPSDANGMNHHWVELYVSNFAPNVINEEDVINDFAQFGTITLHGSLRSQQHRGLGSVFLTYSSGDEAARAIQSRNNYVSPMSGADGFRVKYVLMSPSHLRIGNLSETAPLTAIEHVLSQYGRIRQLYPTSTSRRSGYAWTVVEYFDEADVHKARLALNGANPTVTGTDGVARALAAANSISDRTNKPIFGLEVEYIKRGKRLDETISKLSGLQAAAGKSKADTSAAAVPRPTSSAYATGHPAAYGRQWEQQAATRPVYEKPSGRAVYREVVREKVLVPASTTRYVSREEYGRTQPVATAYHPHYAYEGQSPPRERVREVAVYDPYRDERYGPPVVYERETVVPAQPAQAHPQWTQPPAAKREYAREYEYRR